MPGQRTLASLGITVDVVQLADATMARPDAMRPIQLRITILGRAAFCKNRKELVG